MMKAISSVETTIENTLGFAINKSIEYIYVAVFIGYTVLPL
ncbi:MAG: hypothetical protein QXH34_07565 [Ignisphaera sp.]